MKKSLLTSMVMGALISTVGAQGYVPVSIHTNTKNFLPPQAEERIVGLSVSNWAWYRASTNINANNKNLLNVNTGYFQAIVVNGQLITGTGSVVVVEQDAPISGSVPNQSASGNNWPIPSYYPNVLLWYPFEISGATAAYDASGNGLHGAFLPALGKPEVTNYSMLLNLANQSYVCQVNSNGILDARGSCTLSFWIQPRVEITNNNIFLMSGGASNNIGIAADATNLLVYFGTHNYQHKYAVPYGTNLLTNTWNKVVASYSKTAVTGITSANVQVWINKTRLTNIVDATNGFLYSPHKFLIGETDGNPYANKYLDAYLDDIVIMASVQSGTQITNAFNAGRSMGFEEYQYSAPYSFGNISPAFGSTIGVASSQELSWAASSVAVGYYPRWGFSASSMPTTYPVTANNKINIGATKNLSNYFWQVVASNAYGVATNSQWNFSVFTYSKDFYTNPVKLWIASRYDATNKARDEAPLAGTDNWDIVTATPGGNIAYVTNYGLYFPNTNGIDKTYVQSSGSLIYRGLDGVCAIGFWLKIDDLSLIPAVGTGAAGMELFGCGGSGSDLGLNATLWRKAGTPTITTMFSWRPYTGATWNVHYDETPISLSAGVWTHLQFYYLPYNNWETPPNGVSPEYGWTYAISQNGAAFTDFASDSRAVLCYLGNSDLTTIRIGRCTDVFRSVYSAVVPLAGHIDDFYIINGVYFSYIGSNYTKGRSLDY